VRPQGGGGGKTVATGGYGNQRSRSFDQIFRRGGLPKGLNARLFAIFTGTHQNADFGPWGGSGPRDFVSRIFRVIMGCPYGQHLGNRVQLGYIRGLFGNV